MSVLIDKLADKLGRGSTISERKAAIEKLALLAVSPQFEAYGAIKFNRTEAIRNRHEIQFAADSARFLDCWFSEPTQKLLHSAAERF